MENVLKVNGLCKKYKHKTVLNHVDMTIDYNVVIQKTGVRI